MNRSLLLATRCAAVLAASLLLLPLVTRAQAPPDAPPPAREHTWLQQFVGEWVFEGECKFSPDAPPMKSTGTEVARMFGGFWLVADGKSKMAEMPFSYIMTLGYDPATKKYIGTWIDTLFSYLWKYEGSVDATGKILTLEAEGPNMMLAGKITKFRDVMEFKTADHRVLSSSMLGEDGKWVTFMRGDSRRKK